MPSRKFSLDSVVHRNESSLYAEIDNEVVIMSIKQGNYCGLDTIGADIWRRLEKQVKVSELCDALAKEYDADANTIQRDVIALLQQLAAEDLLEVQN